MSSNDTTKQKRRLGDDDDDSGSNGAGRYHGTGGESSSHDGRGGKYPRVAHQNERSSHGCIDVGNYQTATNDGEENSQETIRKLLQQLEEKDQDNKKMQEEQSRFSFETLLTAEAGTFEVVNETSPFSHVNGDHFGARTQPADFVLSNPDGESVRTMIRPSAFVQEFRNRDGTAWIQRPYGSEADICSLVSAAVKDGIALAEEEGVVKDDEVSHRLERGLFGCRPDLMVIRGEDGIGLVAVEVKQHLQEKPLQENDSKALIDYENVVGHAYDQAQAMNAFGQGTSTVVITSLKESYLCSLERDGLCLAEPSNQLVQDDVGETNTSNQIMHDDVAETNRSVMRCTGTPTGDSRAIVQTQSPPAYKSPPTLQAVSFDRASDAGSTKSSPAASASDDSTGSSPDAKTGSTNETSSESIFLAEQNRKEDRTLYSTTKYEPHDLVRLLYNAIKIAKSKYKESPTKIFKLEANKSYEFPKALRVVDGEKEKYSWGKLQATLGSRIESRKHQCTTPRTVNKNQNQIDKHDDKSYYIIGSLGHGSTSNVFQALTSDGEHVAIKVYVKKYDDHGRIIDEASFQNIAKAAVETEKNRLLDFYPELLKDKVKTAKLFGRPCIVMPFIDPLKKSERGMPTTWTSMQKVLGGPFLTFSLRYKQDDERWGHVGNYTTKDGEKHVILYDLADLEELEDGDKESFVKNSLEKFQARIRIDGENKFPVNVKKANQEYSELVKY